MPEPQARRTASATERESDTEYHDGDERPVCVGQWCCGCKTHPIGKPWGWNNERWAAHFRAHHPEGCQ